MVKYGLFLGCNISFNRPDIEQSLRKTLPALGVEIVELEGQSCCPTWGTMPSIDVVGWCAIAARNLAIAEQKGVDAISACNSCYGSLNEARHKMLHNPEILQKVNEILAEVGKKYEGKAKCRHVAWVLYKDVGLEKIKESLKYTLDGLTVAVQPGCHFLWPSEVYPDKEEDPFNPVVLRELCEALGGEAPYYSRLIDCCGMGALRSTDIEKSLILVERKLKCIKEELDADMIVTTCSSCAIQLDDAQERLRKAGKINFSIPVFHYVQILAVCMGFDPQQVAGICVTPRDEIIKTILEGGKK
jgi:heterodisulfide reductase subunit B